MQVAQVGALRCQLLREPPFRRHLDDFSAKIPDHMRICSFVKASALAFMDFVVYAMAELRVSLGRLQAIDHAVSSGIWLFVRYLVIQASTKWYERKAVRLTKELIANTGFRRARTSTFTMTDTWRGHQLLDIP